MPEVKEWLRAHWGWAAGFVALLSVIVVAFGKGADTASGYTPIKE